MNAGSPRLGSTLRVVLGEAVVIAVAGALLALLANAVSPRGLKLARDYFPKVLTPTVVAVTHAPAAAVTAAQTNSVLERLRARGLQPLEHAAVVALFQDPMRAQELIVFVDARNDEHYQAGHIPGAHQFDHYRPETHLAAVLGACATAQKIVVYCTGGDCEDSEFAAITLTQAGVPRERLFIYPGGISEWATNGLPQELGARLSGVLKGVGP